MSQTRLIDILAALFFAVFAVYFFKHNWPGQASAFTDGFVFGMCVREALDYGHSAFRRPESQSRPTGA